MKTQGKVVLQLEFNTAKDSAWVIKFS